MEAKVENEILYLSPEDSFVASKVGELRDAIARKINEEKACEKVVLNAVNISVVDSLGVNLIIGIYKECASQNKHFEIANTTDSLKQISDFFRFEDYFPVS